jgi:DNA-binding GntR family transcriptional regulator
MTRLTRPARRPTLTDDVYEAIKGLVMDGTLAPGGRVTIDALARDLEVSPTPVREALARLESDGLVRKRPMAGYTTAPLLDRAEFAQLYEMRLLLEVPAASLAARRRDPASAGRLVEAARWPAEPVDTSGYTGYGAFTAYDARFHELVATLSGNPMLVEAFGHLHAHLHLHRRYLPEAPDGPTGTEHQVIAAAVAAGDAEAAGAAMREHLAASRRRHAVAFRAEDGQDVG